MDRGRFQVAHASLLQVQVRAPSRELLILFEGEADLSTRRVLASALDNIDLRSASSVRLDVSGLTFIDASSTRQLADWATQAREAGVEVTTRGESPILRRIAEILEVQDHLGLTRAACGRAS